MVVFSVFTMVVLVLGFFLLLCVMYFFCCFLPSFGCTIFLITSLQLMSIRNLSTVETEPVFRDAMAFFSNGLCVRCIYG